MGLTSFVKLYSCPTHPTLYSHISMLAKDLRKAEPHPTPYHLALPSEPLSLSVRTLYVRCVHRQSCLGIRVPKCIFCVFCAVFSTWLQHSTSVYLDTQQCSRMGGIHIHFFTLSFKIKHCKSNQSTLQQPT